MAAYGYGKPTNVLIYDSLDFQSIPTRFTVWNNCVIVAKILRDLRRQKWGSNWSSVCWTGKWKQSLSSTRIYSNWRPHKQLSINLNCIFKIPFNEKDCGIPERQKNTVRSNASLARSGIIVNANQFLKILLTTRTLWFFSQCWARKRMRNFN